MIIRLQGPDSPLSRAVGSDLKGRLSPVLYLVGIFSALAIDRTGRLGVWTALTCFVATAIMWIIPDRRIDRVVRQVEPAN